VTRVFRRAAASMLAAVVPLAALGACTSDSSGPADKTAATGEIVRFEFSGDAATIDGTPLPAGLIADAVTMFAAAPAALERAFGVTELNQPGSDQPDPTLVAEILSTEIAVRLIEDELARRKLSLTDNARALATTQVEAYFGDTLDTQAAYKQLLIDRYAEYIVLDQALNGPAPTDAALRAEYDKDPSAYDQACARHILVEAEAEATALVTELSAGGDFAALAKAKSTDTGSGAEGGDLGCQARGVYVEEFEKAVWTGPVGTVQGPVKTDFGYHVIQVTERRTRTFEQAREDIAAALAPEPFAALQSWLTQQWSSRTVTVDERFGTWDAASGRVNPVGVSADGITIGSGPADGN